MKTKKEMMKILMIKTYRKLKKEKIFSIYSNFGSNNYSYSFDVPSHERERKRSKMKMSVDRWKSIHNRYHHSWIINGRTYWLLYISICPGKRNSRAQHTKCTSIFFYLYIFRNNFIAGYWYWLNLRTETEAIFVHWWLYWIGRPTDPSGHKMKINNKRKMERKREYHWVPLCERKKSIFSHLDKEKERKKCWK